MWFVSQKSHLALLLLYKYPRCFLMCRSRERLFLRDASGVAEEGGAGLFRSFQEEINNKYSLTCQQHNICSVTLRWRNEAEAVFENSNIRAQDHEKAR